MNHMPGWNLFLLNNFYTVSSSCFGTPWQTLYLSLSTFVLTAHVFPNNFSLFIWMRNDFTISRTQKSQDKHRQILLDHKSSVN